jgi:cytochrome b subunit of formate dehydrogenase
MSNTAVPDEIERFDLSARIQHVIMFSTFLLLSFTGWGLKYAYQDPASAWVQFWGGAKMAGIIHRAAGVTMLLDFIYHQFYLINKARKKNFRLSLMFVPKDIVHIVHNLMFFFGFRKEKPRFSKFNYMQKIDYWAVYWGMFVIGTSGLFLAFPVTVSAIFPAWSLGWIWDVLFIMHSDEALLAIVFILIFHFYNEHLRSEVFPMNWTWITGKMSVEKLKHHHPAEYEYLFGDKSNKKNG